MWLQYHLEEGLECIDLVAMVNILVMAVMGKAIMEHIVEACTINFELDIILKEDRTKDYHLKLDILVLLDILEPAAINFKMELGHYLEEAFVKQSLDIEVNCYFEVECSMDPLILFRND